MKVIFLDVDGVLNCSTSEDTIRGFIGIDYCAVKLLKEIVDATGAEIVLCSSWKHKWYKDDKDKQGFLANYLDQRLAEEGLVIVDKTMDNSWNRGAGIRNYVRQRPSIESWIILDDEIFDDYAEHGCLSHLVKTSFYDLGLKEHHIKLAIDLLNTLQND